MESNLVTIVIPIYKVELQAFERVSLHRCIAILKDYPKVIVKPSNLDISEILTSLESNIEVEDFAPEFFDGIQGYNNLMLSPLFYERFLESHYILICQLDAYIFKDELKMWCDKDYDYIGAPWIGKKKYTHVHYQIFRRIKKTLYSLLGYYNHDDLIYNVGNGGLSLRKTETFYKIAQTIASSTNHPLTKYTNLLNEDVFWSLKVPLVFDFHKPDWQEALKFAFDCRVKECFQLNDYQLPFGAHGWQKRLQHYHSYIQEIKSNM